MKNINEFGLHSPNYRSNVGIIVRHRNKDVFVAKRLWERHDYWQMPQGGIEADESIISAAKRELKEETGIQSIIIRGITPTWYRYNFPQPIIDSSKEGGIVLGQIQKWVLVDFQGDESEINVNTSNPEFCAYKWMPYSWVIEHVIPFKKSVYKNAFSYFSEYFPCGINERD
ncbi:MAG: RNA pyrophosphohydrolase [Alphaproteobacteria bacterium]|nr:MAG: RNA pyrophosphohydrolase [Alphaproteobacteria bacterium]